MAALAWRQLPFSSSYAFAWVSLQFIAACRTDSLLRWRRRAVVYRCVVHPFRFSHRCLLRSFHHHHERQKRHAQDPSKLKRVQDKRHKLFGACFFVNSADFSLTLSAGFLYNDMVDAAQFWFVFEIARKVLYGIIVSCAAGAPVAQVC